MPLIPALGSRGKPLSLVYSDSSRSSQSYTKKLSQNDKNKKLLVWEVTIEHPNQVSDVSSNSTETNRWQLSTNTW